MSRICERKKEKKTLFLSYDSDTYIMKKEVIVMDQNTKNQCAKLAHWIIESKYTVFFGGAGVSTESGIPDFRSVDGIYKQKYTDSPEAILSHSYFLRNPEKFYQFYREKMIHLDAKPNSSHMILAKMEEKGWCQSVITQNIDGLHQMAGSKQVFELHGSIYRNFCTGCKKSYELQDLLMQRGIPYCSCGKVIKPDVVLYEESLNASVMEKSVDEIRKAQLLIIGGTSLRVYPAAGLLDYFKGKHLVIINKEETGFPGADLCFYQPIGEVFNQVWKELGAL